MAKVFQWMSNAVDNKNYLSFTTVFAVEFSTCLNIYVLCARGRA